MKNEWTEFNISTHLFDFLPVRSLDMAFAIFTNTRMYVLIYLEAFCAYVLGVAKCIHMLRLQYKCCIVLQLTNNIYYNLLTYFDVSYNHVVLYYRLC